MSYNNIYKVVPSFGGMASSKELPVSDDRLSYNTVIVNSNIKIYTNYPSNNDKSPFYFVNKGLFHWSAGSVKTIDLNGFNYSNNDGKFIHIKWDDNTISIFTDHYSRIPLFYTIKDGVFYFSSSINMLFGLMKTDRYEFDKRGLIFYYNFGFSNFDDFLLQDIKSTSGGQQLIYNLNSNELSEQIYHNIYRNGVVKKNINDLNTNKILIDKALLKGTTESLSNFNNIGIAMSGGVDSGYLAQKINECGNDFSSYSIGFKDSYNEFERIDYLAKRLNFKTKKIIVDAKDIVDNYLNLSKYSSYPVYFNNSILNFVYEEACKDGVDVIFDGDGADRMFLGSNGFVRLQRVLRIYSFLKKTKLNHLTVNILSLFDGSKLNNLRFYIERFNNNYPFYGLRQLSNFRVYDKEYENLLSDIALPKELKDIVSAADWHYFIMFSIYYFSPCFLHNQYEFQLKFGIVSNPQFWTDDLVELALSIPVNQKLSGKTTKKVLREAAKTKIDDGYWNLTKIGLQNSYQYIKQSDYGMQFVMDHVSQIEKSEEYEYLNEVTPDHSVDAERLLPYFIWKNNMK